MWKYFKIKELIRSQTAKINGINNTPGAAELHALEALVVNILDPVREMWGQPLYVTSGYRCAKLNKLVGGAKNSQHLYGEAADIVTGKGQRQNQLLFEMIKKSGLPFDQLISEDSDNNGLPNWLHISYTSRHVNRGDVKVLHPDRGLQK